MIVVVRQAKPVVVRTNPVPWPQELRPDSWNPYLLGEPPRAGSPSATGLREATGQRRYYATAVSSRSTSDPCSTVNSTLVEPTCRVTTTSPVKRGCSALRDEWMPPRKTIVRLREWSTALRRTIGVRLLIT